LSERNHRSDPSVVDLEKARAQLRSRGQASSETLQPEIETIRDLLDRGLTAEARSRLTSVLARAAHQPSVLAAARCVLSIAFEMQGEYRDSLDAVAMYEAPESRTKLEAQVSIRLRAQLAVAYNYNGDHPKAIALLQSTLREMPEEDPQMGAVYVALARVYRSISEYPIARDYSLRALDCCRRTADWRGMAEAYFGLATADIHEGQHEESLKNYEQALKLVGDRDATMLLGRTYANMAGACWFLRRPHEGIRYLEKAIAYYERTDHKANAADGYNNLGINLILIGQWERGQAALERALAIATEKDERRAEVPMILDSLGELHTLRGEMTDAQNYLERAVAAASERGNKWYEGQARRTLGRCYLAMGRSDQALTAATRAMELAQEIGDRQAICESHLLLAEAYLAAGDQERSDESLQAVLKLVNDSQADMHIAGEAQRIVGLLEMAKSEAASAAQHFGRSVSIFDLIGDRYRSARAHFELGRAYVVTQPDRAEEHLTRALNIFRELGAKLDIERAEKAAAELDALGPERRKQRDTVVQLLTLRLAEAVASRELLLRELAAVIRQETSSNHVIIFEPEQAGRRIVIAHGCEKDMAEKLAAEVSTTDEASRAKLANKRDLAIIQLRSDNARPATLLISPRDRAVLPGGLSLDPLLRVVELGMDVCALRERNRTGEGEEEESTVAGSSLMTGFIHSSPAMTRLVEEVHKIRSSDVTVLVTGESGTGKELVARAIHALSARRDKIFVPFNCTAVPKELSEG